jgi:hypothetical protein
MTPAKLAQVMNFYDAYLRKEYGADPIQNDEPRTVPEMFNHLCWMCREVVDKFLPAGRVIKASRWLGFVQGVLCERGVFTIDELKNHSRPDTDADKD